MNVNTEIAFTYLITRKKQSIIAALGVMIGIGIYIFMNSIIAGTNEYFESATLNNVPHIRIYNDNDISNASILNKVLGTSTINLISNPQLVKEENKIYNANEVVNFLERKTYVADATPLVTAMVTYEKNGVERSGTVYGVDIAGQDKMFNITPTMVSGTVQDLMNDPNGILLGVGIATDLNLRKGDYVQVKTAKNTTKMLKVVGIFKTTIKSIDNVKSYTHFAIAQQLQKKERSYITEIYVSLKDHNKAKEYGNIIQKETGYTVEDWQTANEQAFAARTIRDVIAYSVVFTILLVAGFGIYNILNMVIYEKIKEIAILKAAGFQGKDIVRIFLTQALIIGFVGAAFGILFGWFISYQVSRIYIGLGNVEYLPMSFASGPYIQGFVFGIITSFFAGYVPARQASKVDPVQIIRS